jgi:antitoxin component YwqK of YwqJK toxin-antitoxin module
MKYVCSIAIIVTLCSCSMISVEKEYYASGELKSEKSFILGFAEGYYRVYYEDGKLKDSISMAHDFMNGLAKSYYPNGILESEGIFRDGKKNGFYKEYYENGELKSEGDFKENIADSIAKEYNSNGQLQTRTLLSDGEILSIDYFYPTGKMKKRVYYKDGNAIEHTNFDEDGVPLLPSSAFVQPRYKKDTIIIGETFIADIFFLAHNINSLTNRHVLIGELDDDDCLIGETKELPLEKNSHSVYTNTPKHVGKYELSGALQYTKPSGLVVKAPFRLSYYVKEKLR